MQDNQQRPEDRTQENISEQARIRRDALQKIGRPTAAERKEGP